MKMCSATKILVKISSRNYCWCQFFKDIEKVTLLRILKSNFKKIFLNSSYFVSGQNHYTGHYNGQFLATTVHCKALSNLSK